VLKTSHGRHSGPSLSPEPGWAGLENHGRALSAEARLSALSDSELLDTAAEEAFDRFTRLAARCLKVPVALISLVDDHRQFFKSAVGLPEPWASRREMPLSHSFCQYGVTMAGPLIVSDAREHPWLEENLGIRELGAIAYAGFPLVTVDGQVLGMFCVIDTAPHPWSDGELATLRELATMVATELELRARARALARAHEMQETDRALLRSVLDCMEDSVVVVATDGSVVLSNHAAQRARPAEVLRTANNLANYGIFMPDGVTPLNPEDAPSKRALLGHSVRDEEFVRRFPGEPEQTHSVNSSPIRDAAGVVRGAVSVGRDVTKAKAAQKALERNEVLLRTVLQNLPNGAVLLFDAELRYLMADGEQLLLGVGFTARDLIGKTLYDVVPPERVEPVASRYRLALRGEVQEFEVKRGDRIFAVTIVPVYDEDGAIIAGMAMVYDVTAHKRDQEALREQTLVFQSTLEHMREGVLMVNSRGELAVFNHAAKSLLGVPPHEESIRDALGKWQAFEGDGSTPMPAREEPLHRVLRGVASIPTDVVLRAVAESKAVHLHVTVDPIVDEQGELVGQVAVMHDVTAQRMAESSARKQAASVQLLQTIAEASNTARSVREAFQVALERVCAFMSWPIGHVCLVQGKALKSSGWWYDQEPTRYASFRAASSEMVFHIDCCMIGHVMGSGLATWVSDLSAESTFLRSRPALTAGLNSGFAFPVLIEDEVVAVLEFYSERREEADLPLLSLMANIGTQLGRVVERERARKAVEERAEAIRSQSIGDELTGLYNRRGFLELARQQLHIAQREKREALLFFVDLNGMKQINDEFGHDEGDRALVDTADVLRDTFRASDVVSRLGGDEFVAFVLDADASKLDALAARIRQAMATRNAQGARRYRLSASIGAAPYDAARGQTIESLLAQADTLMYEQKRARRAGLVFSIAPQAVSTPRVLLGKNERGA
jgi:diguanylate cyclase (GGDEF)-like protein/PAS domain S-box-containing protein